MLLFLVNKNVINLHIERTAFFYLFFQLCVVRKKVHHLNPWLPVAKTLFFSNHISGCGSVLNIKGEVEMDAMVMDGKTLASGAVSIVRNIANPIQLARLVMDKVHLNMQHEFLGL